MNKLENKYLKGLDYGVELFKYHADQRLRCIRYYTAILVAIFVGVIGIERVFCVQIATENYVGIIMFGIFVAAGITLLFWLLDIRNRVLTECAESGLKSIEKKIFMVMREMQIVYHCEKNDEAWHYGDILPIFFPIVLIILTITEIIFICCDSCMSYQWLDWVLIIVIMMVVLPCGIFAEGKFFKKSKPNKLYVRFYDVI